jgi:hypothetical protein
MPTATIVPGVDLPNDDSITRQDLNDAIANLTIADLTQAHMDQTGTITAVITVSASEPGSPFVGMGWWDTTLDLMRIYSTIDAIGPAFHPVSEGHQLWENDDAATVPAARVVARDPSVGSRLYNMATARKQKSVIGVSRESAVNGANGVLAMVGSGAIASVLISTSSGAIAKGDYLTSSTETGTAIGAGPERANPFQGGSGLYEYGAPVGAFAKALAAASAGAEVACQMLGHIGEGATRLMPEEVVGGVATTSATNAAGASDWLEADITTNLDDADQVPIAAIIKAEVEVVETTGDQEYDVSFDVSLDQAVPHFSHRFMGRTGAASEGSKGSVEFIVPLTDDTTLPIDLGYKFAHRATVESAGGQPESVIVVFFIRGYIH